MSTVTEAVLTCPECGSPMCLKGGPHGPFYACVRYPVCNNTHGAHRNGRPLGTPADAETKRYRQLNLYAGCSARPRERCFCQVANQGAAACRSGRRSRILSAIDGRTSQTTSPTSEPARIGNWLSQTRRECASMQATSTRSARPAEEVATLGKAKAVLMGQGCSEPEAYTTMRYLATSTRRRLIDLAERVVARDPVVLRDLEDAGAKSDRLAEAKAHLGALLQVSTEEATELIAGAARRERVSWAKVAAWILAAGDRAGDVVALKQQQEVKCAPTI